MDFEGVRLTYVNGEDGKYGVVIIIPKRLKVKHIHHKISNDPLQLYELIGINLEEA